VKLKIGLDVHGVCTDSAELFAALSKLFVDQGHEVHIITGPRVGPKLIEELKTLNITYTHIFSITDYHVEVGNDVKFDAKGNPFVEDYLWDRTKADYCLREGIHLHFDDSDAYNYFFKTPYARFYSKTKRTHYVKSY
jgi:hypothetical protein